MIIVVSVSLSVLRTFLACRFLFFYSPGPTLRESHCRVLCSRSCEGVRTNRWSWEASRTLAHAARFSVQNEPYILQRFLKFGGRLSYHSYDALNDAVRFLAVREAQEGTKQMAQELLLRSGLRTVIYSR